MFRRFWLHIDPPVCFLFNKFIGMFCHFLYGCVGVFVCGSGDWGEGAWGEGSVTIAAFYHPWLFHFGIFVLSLFPVKNFSVLYLLLHITIRWIY